MVAFFVYIRDKEKKCRYFICFWTKIFQIPRTGCVSITPKKQKRSGEMIDIVTEKESKIRNIKQIGTPQEEDRIYLSDGAYR